MKFKGGFLASTIYENPDIPQVEPLEVNDLKS